MFGRKKKKDSDNNEVINEVATYQVNTEIVEYKQPGPVTSECRLALKTAQVYSDSLYLSKQGVYDQLISEFGEHFSMEAVQYAMAHIKANWNLNALKKGKKYSDKLNLSKKGIYEMLISPQGEKFTEAEAQYAIDNLDVDYKENALAKAKTYKETMDLSPSSIHRQLTSSYGEKFTSEEADYAIAHLETVDK